MGRVSWPAGGIGWISSLRSIAGLDGERDRDMGEPQEPGAAASRGAGSPAARGGPSWAELPAGTVTFLFTDVEGSTRLWESVPEAMEEALERHNRLLTAVIEEHDGMVVTSRGEGDSLFAIFPSAAAAVEAAGACQLRLGSEPWPAGAALRVRMGLHTG